MGEQKENLWLSDVKISNITYRWSINQQISSKPVPKSEHRGLEPILNQKKVPTNHIPSWTSKSLVKLFMTNKWHGIILDLEFIDPNFSSNFNIFAKRKSKTNPWTLFGVEIEANNFDKSIKLIQENLKNDQPYYAHFYNDEDLIVVFKNKVVKVKPIKSSWTPIIEYGRTLGIPEAQLDFWPNRFQDEIHYFNPEDFI